MTGQVHANTVVIERFSRLRKSGRMAHAYLLVGPKNSGKTQTALSIAQLVNCENLSPEGAGFPCEQCASCRKIISSNHPDVYTIGRDETEAIKIEEIRFLLGRVRLMAFEAKTKVFILRNIESMTLEAANALLKTLEEPAPNTLMILTTSVFEANLETIRSRCHVVKFFPKEENPAYNRKIMDEMLLNRNNDSFLKDLSSDHQQTAQALRMLLGFFKDVLLVKSGAAAAFSSQEYAKPMEKFAGYRIEDLNLIIRQIVKTKQLVDENLNTKMSLSLLKEHIWAN
jgi:DNA polymerase III delta' subunit